MNCDDPGKDYPQKIAIPNAKAYWISPGGEIMEDLIHKGWIRIRLKERPGFWEIELSQLTESVKEHLRSWADALIEVNPDRKYYDTQITELDKGLIRTVLTVEDMANGKWLKEGKNLDNRLTNICL